MIGNSPRCLDHVVIFNEAVIVTASEVVPGA
jgi:hypothetical protein